MDMKSLTICLIILILNNAIETKNIDLVRKPHFIGTLIGIQVGIRMPARRFKVDNISFNHRMLLYIGASIHGHIRLFYLTNNQAL